MPVHSRECWRTPPRATHARPPFAGRAQACRHASGSAPPRHAAPPAASPRRGMPACHRLRRAQAGRRAPARAVHACHAPRGGAARQAAPPAAPPRPGLLACAGTCHARLSRPSGARPGRPAHQRLSPARACRHASDSAPPRYVGTPAASPRPGMPACAGTCHARLHAPRGARPGRPARQRHCPAQVCRHVSGSAAPRYVGTSAALSCPCMLAGAGTGHAPLSRLSGGAPRFAGTPAASPRPGMPACAGTCHARLHAPRGRAQAGRHVSGFAAPRYAGTPAAPPRPEQRHRVRHSRQPRSRSSTSAAGRRGRVPQARGRALRVGPYATGPASRGDVFALPTCDG